MYCQMCGSPMVEVGILGSLHHYRCIGCGMYYNSSLTEEELNALAEEQAYDWGYDPEDEEEEDDWLY